MCNYFSSIQYFGPPVTKQRLPTSSISNETLENGKYPLICKSIGTTTSNPMIAKPFMMTLNPCQISELPWKMEVSKGTQVQEEPVHNASQPRRNHTHHTYKQQPYLMEQLHQQTKIKPNYIIFTVKIEEL